MAFQIGKYYKHSGGGMMHIVSAGKTTIYGWCLIAERHGQGDLSPVGSDEDAAQNWSETTEADWLTGFSVAEICAGELNTSAKLDNKTDPA